MTTKAPFLFINYRNADTGHIADRLYADLNSRLAPDQVFLDNERLEGADAWPERLRAEAKRASVMMVLIGKNWLTAQDVDTGDRRLNVPGDWVRIEIETGLNAVPYVLPVLLDSAAPPTSLALRTVPSIGKLADLQAMKLRRDTWIPDVEALTKFLCDRDFKLRENSSPESSGALVPVEPVIHLAMDRVEPLREQKRGRSLVYGTVVLSTGDVAYGKGLMVQLALENLSGVDVVVRKLDLIVEEHDEQPLEDYDYGVIPTSGMHLEIPASDLQTVTLTRVEAAGQAIALAKNRFFLKQLGTPEAQHTLTARVLAQEPGLWKMTVRATYVDAATAFEPRSVTSEPFFVVMK